MKRQRCDYCDQILVDSPDKVKEGYVLKAPDEWVEVEEEIDGKIVKVIQEDVCEECWLENHSYDMPNQGYTDQGTPIEDF